MVPEDRNHLEGFNTNLMLTIILIILILELYKLYWIDLN